MPLHHPRIVLVPRSFIEVDATKSIMKGLRAYKVISLVFDFCSQKWTFYQVRH